jgi:NADP-dependent 3-hydroxy acid dehydrogenase YdfG
VNITDRASVRAMLKQTVLAYGGVDHIVVTAGSSSRPTAKATSPTTNGSSRST